MLSGGRTISYEYDEEERITKVDDSVDGITTYTYDALGQLLTETVNGAVVNTMTYDNYGNIRTKNGVEYTFGDEKWKDLLTGVGDQSISYDAQGNPISYLGHNLTWEKGRQLKSFDNIQYTYNANGIRTSKTIDGIRHNYILDGSKILMESWDGNVIIPIYDNEESVCGIYYNNKPYYFQKNLQGDVIGIVDKNAKVVAQYSYDAWGIPTIVQDSTECGIAQINPYRYRGYYFDHETGMYYLNTRYYSPVTGRFVNVDDPEILQTASNSDSVLGLNMMAYCHNNVVNNIDETGMWLARLVCGVAAAALFATLAYVVCKVVSIFVPMSKKTIAAITVAFGVLGGVIGAALGPSFLLKHSPKLLKAINKIEKTRFSIKAIKPNGAGNIFGIVISNTLIIMLHAPHPKYNEWYFHIQVEVKLGRKQVVIWKKPIAYVNKKTWRH